MKRKYFNSSVKKQNGKSQKGVKQENKACQIFRINVRTCVY